MVSSETTSRVQRFRFASFDAKEQELPAPAEIKPEEKTEINHPPGPMPLPLALPAITEKDLQNARSDAQAQGYREGYAAAQSKFNKEAAAREEALQSLFPIIANRITIAAEAHARILKGYEALMGKLIMAAARKVASDALKREPYAAVETMLHECMGLIAGAPKVNVIVSSALAAGLRQRIDMLAPLLQGFTGELKVAEDAALMDQDCRVEWENGYSERNAEALWSAIEAIVMKTNINA
jgi:flagellar biosynthesis/type III secretory pathway protein FliH